jgi:S-formylglutathione hydrolase FrmB
LFLVSIAKMTTLAATFLIASALAAGESPIISTAAVDEHGFLVHEVASSFQQGATQIRVLLPSAVDSNRKYPVIYVLPVEARSESRYGDGLGEAKTHNLPNKHQAIFVAPTFSHLPWYADHPTDPTIRQETYFLKVVVPFVEKTYPTQATPEGRLLLGFSKSGWGAWSLLLRHPEQFGRAAAWDAPLMMDQIGKYGTAAIFGSQATFEPYRIADLLPAKRNALGNDSRLILTGYGNFRAEHEQAHAILRELTIPHEYRDGPHRKHDWHSGWMPEAVDLLVSNSTK